jgi:hypothetical protein
MGSVLMRSLAVKRLPLTIALLAFGAGAALAEPPRGGVPIEKLATELQLDEYQKGELKRILDEQISRLEAAREQFMVSGERPSPEEMRKHMRQADQEIMQQLQSVLTAEQIDKFKELQERRRQRMREGMPPPPSE